MKEYYVKHGFLERTLYFRIYLNFRDVQSRVCTETIDKAEKYLGIMCEKMSSANRKTPKFGIEVTNWPMAAWGRVEKFKYLKINLIIMF